MLNSVFTSKNNWPNILFYSIYTTGHHTHKNNLTLLKHHQSVDIKLVLGVFI